MYTEITGKGTLTTRRTPCVMNTAAGVTSQFVSKILLILRRNPLFVQWAVEMRRNSFAINSQMKKSTAAPIIATSLVGKKMDKVLISNRINRWTGGDELLFCSRVYVNTKLYGGFWIPLLHIIDAVFYCVKGQKRHCFASYLYERRRSNAETQTQVHHHKGATSEARKPSTGDKASPSTSETRNQSHSV